MQKKNYIAFIGTNSVRGSRGIYTVAIDGETLQAKVTSTQEAYNTGALVLSHSKKYLYAASEGMTFMGKASGGAMAYKIGENGVLSYLGGTVTGGQRPCCLDISEKDDELYAANFFGQSLAMIPVNPDGSLQPMRLLVEEKRGLDGPMTGMHCVRALADESAVGAIAVGPCRYIVYDRETGAERSSFFFGERLGPRHFITSADGTMVYGFMQMPAEVHTIRVNDDGTMERLQIVPVIRPGHVGLCGGSELRMTPNGKLVIAATRGADTLCVMRVLKDGTLEVSDFIQTPGQTPRDIQISPDGRFVVSALQFSDELCVHEIDYENATLHLRCSGVSIPSPAAVEIMEA